MRMVIQRVSEASVRVEGEVTGSIGRGLAVLVGFGKDDSERDAKYMADRLTGIRLFADAGGKLNLNIREAGGSFLIVSQFTLFGDCTKGRRPSFDGAAGAEKAAGLYDYFLNVLRATGIPTAAGVFRAHMELCLVNDGPVTILCDSEDR